MKLQKHFKKEILQIELSYLQLLCIQETVDSLEHIFHKQDKIWPELAKRWQGEVALLNEEVKKSRYITELLSTSLADKFVPKGYPKETFNFILSLYENPKRYEELLEEFVPNRVVSAKKLLFFSKQIQCVLDSAQTLLNISPYEKSSFLIKIFKRNESEYFLNTLHQFLNNNKEE
ncbi:hypothetical protein EVJ20_08105 [Exiguobacterium sp. SH0S1]|uniref:hypothetical protein n=1 Tax=Exiguobacterium sp. SH0S1 TaxID=2510949 RepID=UPI00103F38C1|nr:hypothetical protein [Exiguobacterium sp. SH0S1]TCI77911.1 hypothetical protein EVJ20_08105 [Exiguobacterium sp. SH0S1]